jgi:putative ABC transport system permease protein
MSYTQLKFALRNLWRNKFYSLINIGGLAVGIAVSMLILVFVAHELSFDRFHPQAEDIYRMRATFKFGNQEMQLTGMSAYMGPALRESTAGVKNYVRLYNPSNDKLTFKSDAEHIFYEDRVILADPSYFQVFNFPFVQGNPKTVLQQPNQLVVSEKIAKKYFGDSEVLGRTLTLNNSLQYVISGVIKNPPSNASIAYELIAPLNSLFAVQKMINPDVKEDILKTDNVVRLGSFETYLLLSNETVQASVLNNIPKLMRRGKMPESEIKDTKFSLSPLLNLHLNESASGSALSLSNLYIFAGVALLIILLALLNYMSLTTARSSERAREVGVRKAMGAFRAELVGQFYGESILVTLMAFALGFGLAFVLRPLFFDRLDLQIDAIFMLSPVVLLPLGGLLLACIVLAGAYPSFVLSAFRPVEALKGRLLNRNKGGIQIRQGITVFQFTASIVLVIAALVAQQQLNHMQARKLGMHKEQVVMLTPSAEGFSAFRNAVAQVKEVDKIGSASLKLFKDYNSIFFVKSPLNQKEIPLHTFNADAAFFDLLGLSWKINPLELDKPGNWKGKMAINAQAAKELGLQSMSQAEQVGNIFKEPLLGVLQDFHFSQISLSQATPLAVSIVSSEEPGSLYLRLHPTADVQATIAHLSQVFKTHCPEEPFEYFFLDESFDKLFKAEDRMAKMFGIFTGLAIFISCLGLFGLAAYATARRAKEIGIRKVLGATISNVMGLLSKEFLRPVLIAIALASPVAWYLMEQWLKKFAYRIEIEWWIFAAAGVGIVVLALLTVSAQSLRAALANPVTAIKQE